MLFNEDDIRRILGVVDFSTAKLVAQVLGRDFLSKEDLALLRRHGVDLVKLIPKFPPHLQSFLFGRVSSALGVQPASLITYPEFLKFLPTMGQFMPTTAEMAFYAVAAKKTYDHIKGLGERIKSQVQSALSAEEMSYLQAKNLAATHEKVRKEILEGTFEKRSCSNIASKLGEQFGTWDMDWTRIVETECQDVFNLGRSQIMMKDGRNPLVYFDVFPGACKHCIHLYLTNGVGSQPRLFRLSELMANGNNYGLKTKDWKPTIHPVHPFCRCEIRELPEGYEWDEERHEFAPPKDYKPKVERKSKVKITFGDRTYVV